MCQRIRQKKWKMEQTNEPNRMESIILIKLLNLNPFIGAMIKAISGVQR